MYLTIWPEFVNKSVDVVVFLATKSEFYGGSLEFCHFPLNFAQLAKYIIDYYFYIIIQYVPSSIPTLIIM